MPEGYRKELDEISKRLAVVEKQMQLIIFALGKAGILEESDGDMAA